MKKLAVLTFFFSFFLYGWGCGLVSQPFEGSWTASGGEGNFGWTQTYTFRNGSYEITGYPPIQEQGRYEMVEIARNTYVLLLTPTKSDPPKTESYELEVSVSEDGGKFSLDQGQTFFIKI